MTDSELIEELRKLYVRRNNSYKNINHTYMTGGLTRCQVDRHHTEVDKKYNKNVTKLLHEVFSK